jgi:hypothetical protein
MLKLILDHTACEMTLKANGLWDVEEVGPMDTCRLSRIGGFNDDKDELGYLNNNLEPQEMQE